MTEERLFALMGWPPGMNIEPGDMAYKVRALVVTAERDEREACAKVCEAKAEGARYTYQREELTECAASIRERSNASVSGAAVPRPIDAELGGKGEGS